MTFGELNAQEKSNQLETLKLQSILCHYNMYYLSDSWFKDSDNIDKGRVQADLLLSLP